MHNLLTMTKEEIISFVNEALVKEKIVTVLSGGGAVEHYTENKYMSDDMDMINIYNERHSKIKKVMLKLGFKESIKYFIINGRDDIFIEFPSGPLAIGNEFVDYDNTENVITDYGVFKIITLLDCIKDRLSAFFAWDDRQSLYQAVMLFIHNPTTTDNLHLLEKWATEDKTNSIKWNFYISMVDFFKEKVLEIKNTQELEDKIENFLDVAVEEHCAFADVNDFSMDNIMDFYNRKKA